MYGLITQLQTQPGMRQQVSELLVDGLSSRPGLISYAVSEDAKTPTSLWVTEVWRDEDSYRSAIGTTWFKAFVAGAKPMLAEIGESVVARQR